jgi:hypothetical protein
MNTQNVELEFSVKIKYSLEEGASFCQHSAKENLHAAIENERQNNTLTPVDISADWVECQLKGDNQKQFTIHEITPEGRNRLCCLLQASFCFFKSRSTNIIIDLTELIEMERREGLLEDVVEVLNNEGILLFKNDEFTCNYVELHS